jgi:hypothetical protein
MNGHVAGADARVGRGGRRGALALAVALSLAGWGLAAGPATAGPERPGWDPTGVRGVGGAVATVLAPSTADVLAGGFPTVRRGHVKGTMRAV